MTNTVTLSGSRARAHKYFMEKGIPSKKDEAWKYTSLKKLAALDLTPTSRELRLTDLEKFRHSAFHQIFVVNGLLFARKSDKNIFAKKINFSKVNRILSKARKQTGRIRQESLEALNASYSKALNITVKAGSRLDKPLQIVFYSNVSGSSYPRLQIVMEDNSQIQLVETYFNSEGQHFTDALTEINLGKAAELKYLRFQNESKQNIHFGCTRVFLNENAQMESLIYATGSEISRHNLDVHCLGENVNATLNGLTLGGGEQHFDNSTWIDHAIGHCTTQQLYKSLLAGKSKAVFRGQVEIKPGSQKAFSDQLNKNLLLSKEAEADSIPQLNIYADDVKATHGSTVGQISEDEIFYLLSRAINRDKAIELLSLGFVKDLVDRVSHPKIRSWLLKNLESSYQELQ